MTVLDSSFSVLILNFSGLKSSKLINFAGVAHNVLSILNTFTLFILYYIIFFLFKNNSSLRKFYTLR